MPAPTTRRRSRSGPMARAYPLSRAARQRAAEDDRAGGLGVAVALAGHDDLLVARQPARELVEILRARTRGAELAVGAHGWGEAEPLRAAAGRREPDRVGLVRLVGRHAGRGEREGELPLGRVEAHQAGALGAVDPTQRDLP